MRHHFTKLTVIGFLLCAGIAARSAADDDRSPVKATVAGASAQGMFSLVGESINEMVRREYPGSSIVYEPGNNAGSFTRMLKGEVPLSTGHCDLEVQAALAGEAPYLRAYSKDDFGLVARVTDGLLLHVLARADFLEKYKIGTFADLVKKRVPVRVSVNQKGNLTVYNLARAIFDYYGVTEKDILAWGGKIFYVPDNISMDMVKDAKLDMIISTSFPPDRRFVEMGTTTKISLVPLEPEAIDRIAAKLGIRTGVIKANSYSFWPKDYYATSTGCYLSAGKSVPDALTYKIAKAVYTHFNYYQGVHPVFKRYQREMLVDKGNYQLHPGAARFYREVGLLK
ncbi:MAG TPA: TAXI family TRAP transporter solute-binding subunit [Acidiferrobacterales bacterium]|nr:TAXI family TRAP transporter solute-binding subunit [Acidiferrobacterales bacterium]